MKSKVNEWYESLNIGNIGEKFTKKNFIKVFRSIFDKYLYAERFEYTLEETIQKLAQLQGMDGQVNFNFPLFNYEVKTRTRKYNDILIETISVIEQNKPGWFVYSKADIIAYLFLNREQMVEDGFLIILKNLREHSSLNDLEKNSTQDFNSPGKILTDLWP